MTIRFPSIICLLGLLSLLATSCLTLSTKKDESPVATKTYYKNPVLDTILADPSVILDPQTGYFYAYGTEDNWGDGKGSRLIPIMRSKDLVNWTLTGNAFDTKPKWKNRGGLWAPDINYVDKKYYIYYSFSTWGDPNPGIGLAIALNAEGPFTDQGKLFTSKEVNVPNSIDPFYMEDGGKKFLFWGSFSNEQTQGTYGIELSSDGRSVPDLNKKFKIAAGDFEAVMIHKKSGYYYFFGSKGSCCEGINSKYNVRIARSKNLIGPYVDKEGKNINERGNGTLFIHGNEAFVGTGHNAELITDDLGTDWFIYHGIDSSQGRAKSGASRRVLLMDPVIWKNGWPEIAGNEPSSTTIPGPVFKR